MVRTSDGTFLRGVVEGAGPPIVLCHGGPGLWDYLNDLAGLLRESFTVHRWDQRGCGRSGPAPDYGLDVALRDVQDLKLALGVRDRWAVIGHSWGAHLALLTAIEHPESTSALVCISGTGTPSWWRTVGSDAYRAERAKRMPAHAQRRLDHLDAARRTQEEEVEFRRLSWATDFVERAPPPEALEAMVSSPLPINWEVNRALAGAERYAEDQFLALCARCEVPALFIHGADDPQRARPDEGARLLCDRIPGAHFARIEGAGHLPWVERPVQTTGAISDLLHQVL